MRTRRILFYAVLLTAVGLRLQTASASSSDRTVLYGLSQDGKLVTINTSTGATTLVRSLPYPLAIGQYKNLAVYKGTFVTEISSGMIAFGTKANDQLTLGPIDASSGLVDFSEYPSTGLPRGWVGGSLPGGAIIDYIRETDPAAKLETSLQSSSYVYPTTYFTNNSGYGGYFTCDEGVINSAFFGNYKSYFTHRCFLHDGYSHGVYPALVRAELQNGTWVKTLDTLSIEIADTFVADPVSDGVLWVAGGYPNNFTLTKVNINPTPPQYTSYYPTYLNYVIVGMAFGPPTTDVISPRDQPAFQQALKPWTPIQMRFDLSRDDS